MSDTLAVAITFGALGSVTLVVVGSALRERRRQFLAKRAENPGATWWELAQ